MTVHQAKGLEFPVVVIRDGEGRWDTRPESCAWRMERNSQGWMMDLAGLTWEEPRGLGIKQTERAYLDAERRRAYARRRELAIAAGNWCGGKTFSANSSRRHQKHTLKRCSAPSRRSKT